jgi:Leucine-rich repeat (LRR) protein
MLDLLCSLERLLSYTSHWIVIQRCQQNIILKNTCPHVQGASSDCEAANTLSGALDHMHDVRKLKIENTSFVPEAIFELITLRELTLSHVSGLPSLPHGIKLLTNLRVLKIDFWKHLRYLPSSICDLEFLQELDLFYTGTEGLPSDISKLPLTRLRLKLCTRLELLPPLGDLEHLNELELWGTAIEDLPSCISKLQLTYL